MYSQFRDATLEPGSPKSTFPVSRHDRHRGGGHPPTPATPPCIRVRTRRFESVALTLVEQTGKPKRTEVRVRKRDVKSLGPRKAPQSVPTTGRVAGQSRVDSKGQQGRSATAACLPLPPQRGPKPHAHPASQTDQHRRRFAEAKIIAPTPHVRGQFRNRRLHADAFGPSRDLPDSSLEPGFRFRRNDAPNLSVANY